jgi:ferredoxin--NADP+ reductase
MTAPVTQSAVPGGTLVQFVLPKDITLATAPEPIDERVRLREVPATTWGVIRYSGSWSQANYEEHLEFLSIKVPDGPLTSRLQHIQVGDKIVVGRKPTGTLLIDYLLPGKNLYLLGSGTGLAPFLSVARDPDTYERFEKVIVVHGVREVQELAYHDYLSTELQQHEFLGEMVRKQMLYYPTVTREAYEHQGRITDLIASDKLPADLGLSALDPAVDRIMICGSPGLNKDMRAILDARGFKEGSTTTPGDYVVERAFVEQ